MKCQLFDFLFFNVVHSFCGKQAPYYSRYHGPTIKLMNLLWDIKELHYESQNVGIRTPQSTYQPKQTSLLVVISQLISWTKETGGGKGTLNKFNRHGPMDFFSILLTYRCTTLGLTVSCLWWQQPHCTESVAKKYLSTWKAERNQLKRMPITSDISANNKEIFIYEMIVWAVMVWLDCPFRQLMLQKGHDYPALLKKQIIWPLSLSLFSL